MIQKKYSPNVIRNKMTHLSKGVSNIYLSTLLLSRTVQYDGSRLGPENTNIIIAECLKTISVGRILILSMIASQYIRIEIAAIVERKEKHR